MGSFAIFDPVPDCFYQIRHGSSKICGSAILVTGNLTGVSSRKSESAVVQRQKLIEDLRRDFQEEEEKLMNIKAEQVMTLPLVMIYFKG